MAGFSYDNQGRRTTITRGASPATTSYSYNAVSQLGSLTHNLDGAGTANDVVQSFGYNPAGQITTRTLSNDSFAFTNRFNVNRGYATNGLNQYTSAGPANFTYDANGNLTSDGSVTYGYDTENRLVSASGAKTASLLYDPLGRLVRTHDGNTANATWFVYDGDSLVAEFNGSGTMLKRYLHGPGVDEPMAWFDGATIGTANRHDLFANAQGSIVAVTSGSGATEAINRYDEFGIPSPGAVGRFQYTGQAWIPELGVYYYKARMYSPTLGRFLQTDPIGYDDGPNWYNYVGSDPINWRDPTGMLNICIDPGGGSHSNGAGGEIVVTQTFYICFELDLTKAERGVRNENGGGLRRQKPDTSEPQNMQDPVCPASAQPIAYTPQGDTRGDNPRPGGGGYNTDLPGSTLLDAGAVYTGLTRLAGDTSSRTLPDITRPNILSRSYPSGIQLRLGADLRYRIDIPANTFQLRVPETIHFRGGKGNMCPTR